MIGLAFGILGVILFGAAVVGIIVAAGAYGRLLKGRSDIELEKNKIDHRKLAHERKLFELDADRILAQEQQKSLPSGPSAEEKRAQEREREAESEPEPVRVKDSDVSFPWTKRAQREDRVHLRETMGAQEAELVDDVPYER